MDDPQSDSAALERTLRQFVLVNALLSRRGTVLTRYLLNDLEPGREYRVLDLGAGGGDIARWLVARARKRGLRVRVTAADHDPRVVACARRWCASEPLIDVVQVKVGEALGEHDYVICNHVLHHVPDEEFPALLQAVYDTGARRFIANDLLRSNASLVGFRLFAALFLRNSFSRVDGEISIKKGFRPEELRDLMSPSPWSPDTRIVRLSPGRVCVVADRPRSDRRVAGGLPDSAPVGQ